MSTGGIGISLNDLVSIKVISVTEFRRKNRSGPRTRRSHRHRTGRQGPPKKKRTSAAFSAAHREVRRVSEAFRLLRGPAAVIVLPDRERCSRWRTERLQRRSVSFPGREKPEIPERWHQTSRQCPQSWCQSSGFRWQPCPPVAAAAAARAACAARAATGQSILHASNRRNPVRMADPRPDRNPGRSWTPERGQVPASARSRRISRKSRQVSRLAAGLRSR